MYDRPSLYIVLERGNFLGRALLLSTEAALEKQFRGEEKKDESL